ncbi:MAG: hypothetical protein IPN36_15285 [Bacteroidetes bacterium]|nr:hypothetical protein [Bacteroidota bacterium]
MCKQAPLLLSDGHHTGLFTGNGGWEVYPAILFREKSYNYTNYTVSSNFSGVVILNKYNHHTTT